MKKENLSGIIEFLTIVQNKQSFLMTGSPTVVSYLEGFNHALMVLGINNEEKDMAYANAVQKRGWKFSSNGAWIEMQDKGMKKK